MNFNKIVDRLYDWRKERRLGLRGQIEGLLKNISGEVDEYLVARNDFEKVDAICDICVFCFNAMGDFARGKDLIKGNFANCLEDIEKKIIQANALFERADELVSKEDGGWQDNYKKAIALKCQLLDLLWEAISLCAAEIEKMGFDFKKSMDETLKEIESRTGHWDEAQNKFIKDNRGSYIADYSKCKRSAK